MIHPARQVDFKDLYNSLQMAVQEGLIYEHKGDDGLHLYCYSDETVYERQWNTITLMARGLIIHPESEAVVATPFPKFFNVGEAQADGIPDLPFETFEKLDGSLIIIFYHQGRWRCATKGSLSSDQAKWAQGEVDRCYSDHLTSFAGTGITYLCEAIYPSNRIVVNYPTEATGLHLLGAYQADGSEFSYQDLKQASYKIGMAVVQRHPYDHLSELMEKAKTLDCNSEGWVIRFSNGLRLKIKGDEYCRIHRMISHLTPLAVWETMRDSPDDLTKIRKDLPEEFWADFDLINLLLLEKLEGLLVRISLVNDQTAHLSDKELGLSLGELPNDIARFIFPFRKANGKVLAVPRTRHTLFEVIRPDRNVLEGYRASSSMSRVQEAVKE